MRLYMDVLKFLSCNEFVPENTSMSGVAFSGDFSFFDPRREAAGDFSGEASFADERREDGADLSGEASFDNDRRLDVFFGLS